MGQATGDPNKSAAPRVATPAPVAAEEEAPWEEPATPAVKSAPAAAAPTGESASRAQDILAMIRNRQK
jgi:hypothetical protein